MGLLDWLLEVGGDSTGVNGNPMPMGGLSDGFPAGMDPMGNPQPTNPQIGIPPMPTMQPSAMESPMMGGLSDGFPAGPIGGSQPGYSPISPLPDGQPMPPMAPMAGPPGGNIPLPMARPQPPSGELPMQPSRNIGEAVIPSDVSSSNRGGGRMMDEAPQERPGSVSLLGRALGLDPNQQRQMIGSLAAGLKAAGANSHKPGLAAFAGSLGAGLEGGQNADKDLTKEQQGYIRQALEAQKAGDQAKYMAAQTALAISKTEAVKEGRVGGGRESVVNSPQQLFLRGMKATNEHMDVRAAENIFKERLKNDPSMRRPETIEAQKNLEAVNQRVKADVFKQLKITPEIAEKASKLPGSSDQNPAKPTSRAEAEKLPDGAWFVNPADGRVLIKRSKPAAGAGSAASAPPQSSSVIPSIPGADSSDDTED
jgi:hypothetical protein